MSHKIKCAVNYEDLNCRYIAVPKLDQIMNRFNNFRKWNIPYTYTRRRMKMMCLNGKLIGSHKNDAGLSIKYKFTHRTQK